MGGAQLIYSQSMVFLCFGKGGHCGVGLTFEMVSFLVCDLLLGKELLDEDEANFDEFVVVDARRAFFSHSLILLINLDN